MFPHVSSVQVMWQQRKCWIQARSVDCVDPSPHDHPSTHVREIVFKWDGLTYHLETRGCIRSVRSSSNERHWRNKAIINGFIANARSWRSSSEDPHRTVDRDQRRTTINARSWPDRRSIVARSWPIRRKMGSHDRSKWWTMIAVRSWPSNPHFYRIKQPRFLGQNPL